MPKLDRIPHFDPRSRSFGIRSLIPGPVIYRKRMWTLPSSFPLDQGAEGACVGFGWAAELAATPAKIEAGSNAYASFLYQRSRQEDQDMGNNWDEGASVLAGAKATQKLGKVRRYHWAFGAEEVVAAIIRKGPVILGINWYESMYETEPDTARIRIGGSIAGGHCILAMGFLPRCDNTDNEHAVVLMNSWGPNYGINGRGFLALSDLDRLLRDNGEACIATDMRPVIQNLKPL